MLPIAANGDAGRPGALVVGLNPFTCELASAFRSACEKAGLELQVHCPPLPEPVYVDRDMWEKVVLNLVSNAFKFILEGEIEVAVRAAGGRAELTVRDTGAGIPPQEIPRLFERFHRVEGTPGRTQDGSGIGLALVQELVRLHGGEVCGWRASSAGARRSPSTLPFGRDHLPGDRIGAARTLPATTVGAAPFVEEALRWIPETEPEWRPPDAPLFPAGAHPASAAGGGQKPRILLADDNSDMRDYIRRLLSPEYEVTAVAEDGACSRPPGGSGPTWSELNGYDAARRIRAQPWGERMVLVAVTGWGQEEDRRRTAEAGSDGHLVKPVDYAAVLELLASFAADERRQAARPAEDRGPAAQARERLHR